MGDENLPLKGLRVVEFCWIWAGPMVGQHLADLGAEVVKVEWFKRFDLYRTRGVERLRGKMSEETRRESSYSFQSLNRNKIGFAADLKKNEGLALVKDLIKESDILLENFTVGTLDRLGLGAKELDRLNKQLVVVSLSATGRGSSIEQLRSYGLMLSALGGYEGLITDNKGDFIGSPTFVMSDPNSALFGVFAALAGVLHARETGVGSTYECSQVEAVVSLVNTPPRERPVPSAVHGVFESADGEFVAVTLAKTPNADTFAEWVKLNDLAAVMKSVRADGGIATKISNLEATETSEVFEGTDVRQDVEHPVSGVRSLVATPWRFDGKRPPIRKAAPLLGKDTEEILERVLGYDEKKITAVRESGVITEH